jgi:hypothetical protein
VLFHRDRVGDRFDPDGPEVAFEIRTHAPDDTDVDIGRQVAKSRQRLGEEPAQPLEVRTPVNMPAMRACAPAFSSDS